MPDIGENESDSQRRLDLDSAPIQLPPVVPPQTTAPVQFNQQVNIQQIPPQVWQRLSPEQIVDLSKTIVSQVERIDQRHFDLAKEQAQRDERSARLPLIMGGVLALVGFGVTAYMAAIGSGIVAGIVATFLATIVAVVVGHQLAE